MKIYTKTGDKGTTSLVGGTRVAKSDIRLEAYGTVDELNSWFGFIRSLLSEDCYSEINRVILRIQNLLFDLGCALATEADSKYQPKQLTTDDVMLLESEIDSLETLLPRHNKFILPGGTPAASAANIARTVCRRAERVMSQLPGTASPGQEVSMQFINRLSDYLFVLGRRLNQIAGHSETFWE